MRLLLLISFILSDVCLAQNYNIEEILAAVDDVGVYDKLNAEIELEIHTKLDDRIVKLEYWRKGQDKVLTKVTYPKKDIKAGTLRVKDQIFNYHPNQENIEQANSDFSEGFFHESHFTTERIVGAEKLLGNYKAKVSRVVGDMLVIKGKSIKPNKSECEYVRVKYDVEKKIPLSRECFDEQKTPTNTIVFDKAVKVNGKFMPCLVTVYPKASSLLGEYSKIKIRKINTKSDIPESYFTRTYLSGN